MILPHGLYLFRGRNLLKLACGRLRRTAYVNCFRQVELSRLKQLLSRRVVADAQNDAIANGRFFDRAILARLDEAPQIADEGVK